MKRRLISPARRWYLVLSVLFASLLTSHADSQVLVWGANGSGQTTVPSDLTNVVAVAIGFGHCLALNNDGTVVAWGDNSSRQRIVPAELTNAIGISAGGLCSMALREDGTVAAWGGYTTGLTNVFRRLDNVAAISQGSLPWLVLQADGRALSSGGFIGTFGTGPRKSPRDLTNILAVSAGVGHALVLRADGTIVGWGGNSSGEATGVPNIIPTRLATGAVVQVSGVVLSNVVAISAGLDHSLALQSNGTVLAWGNNSFGQTNVPSGLSNVIAIAAGNRHSAALVADGTVVRWGWNVGGILNLPANLSNVVAIAAGGTNLIALVRDGAPYFAHKLVSPQTAPLGSTVPLSVTVIGTPPPTYQWFFNGSGLPLQTNASLTLSNFQWNLGGVYMVVASNSLDVVSNSTILNPVPVWAWGSQLYHQRRVPVGLTNVSVVAAGGGHYLALRTDGSVVRWGKDSSELTNVPPGLADAVGVAAGGDHAMALKADGSVVAWGRNWDGQTNVPLSATNVVSIAAGSAHSVALRADGTVVAWGKDDLGQADVSFLATEVTAIAAGHSHTLALRRDRTVAVWGSVDTVPAGATNVLAIAAGWEHCLALRADGSVVAWGDNTFGQTNVPAAATNVVGIASGWYHNLALRADGTIVAWGGGVPGVIALPTTLPGIPKLLAAEDNSLALIASGPPQFGPQLTSIASHAGGIVLLQANLSGALPLDFQWYHGGVAVTDATNQNLVLTGVQGAQSGNYVLWATNASGIAASAAIGVSVDPSPATITTVGTWGDDVTGQVTVPNDLKNPRAIAAGAFHNLALNEDGTVVAWGNNVGGQTNVPAAATNVIGIAAGCNHSLALRADGTVAGWGQNDQGQVLGFPTTNSAFGGVPGAKFITNGLVRLNGTILSNVTAVSGGWAHSLALLGDGTVVGWGNNDFGQTNIPAGLGGVISISAGYYHNLALRSDHTVVAWGPDDFVPATAVNVVAIDAGWGHSLALRSDGSVVAWGDNTYSQSTVPADATNIVAIAAGWYHSAVVRADGTVLVWGKGFFGVSNIPGFIDQVVSIDAGDQHTVVLRVNGPPQSSPGGPVTVHVGEPVALGSPVSGSRPMTFQWYHDGVAVPGATSAWLQIAGAQAADSGSYSLVTGNSIAQTSNAPVIVTVLGSPGVVGPVQMLSAAVGRPFCLPATISGESPLTFAWYRDGVKVDDSARVSGAGTGTLCFSSAEYGDNGVYSLVLNNSFGSATGVVARLSVSPVLAWGNNSFGQLAIPFSATNIVALSAGEDHSLALRADGRVVAWGDNSSGQCTVPASLSNVVGIAAGDAHSLALQENGVVVAWGDNSLQQSTVPASLTNVIAIAAGEGHSLALQLDGTVVSWGGWSGATFAETNVPSSVSNVVAIAANDRGNLALRADGSVVSWGPIPGGTPSNATNIVAISGGGGHNAALRADGQLLLWGRNAYGQTDVPASVSNALLVAAGGDHNLSVGPGGAVAAWGGNYYRQTNVPAGACNVVAIEAGGAHSLALDRSGQHYLSFKSLPTTATLGDELLLRAGPGDLRTTYQWQFCGTNLLDATNSTLVLGDVGWLNRGCYRLAMSNVLGITYSPPICLSVVRTPLVFGSIQFTNGDFQIHLKGASGTGPLVLLSSPDLHTWSPVQTNSPVIGPVDFMVPVVPGEPMLFYRATEPEFP